MRRYFEPYCRGKITSFHEAKATLALATLEMEETHAHKRLRVEGARDRREFAAVLLKKVRDSAYSGGLSTRAKTQLDELDR